MAYTKASAQFHSAIVSGSPKERALMVFGDDFFNDSDIDINSGLTFTDYFNPDEELMIGGTPSNTLHVTIINDLGLLDSLTWNREFSAYLGVETVVESYSNSYGGILYASINGVIVTVEDTSPYLYCNGTALTYQPSSPVVGLWVYKDYMYAIAEDGTATKYKWSGTAWQRVVAYVQSAFMENKFLEFTGRSVSFDGHYLREFTFNTNVLETWANVSTETWSSISARTWGSFGNITAQVTEYVPLGYFKATRPKVLSSALVEVEAYDRMVNLEKIADGWWNNVLSFPMSINEIIEAFCTRYNLLLDNSIFIDPLPNGTLTYQSNPAKLENVTAREVLSYLAEVTASVAHFTRDGKLRFDWFRTNSLSIPWIFSQTEYSYSVPSVTGVLIQTSENESGVIYGTDDNPYIITDNLLLSELNDATLLAIGQNIYGRIATMPVFPPSNVSITSDWSIEGGDILTVNGVTTPIYVQTITYNGGALATIENSGEEIRPVDSAVSREAFTTAATVANIQVSSDGTLSAINHGKLKFNSTGLHIYNGGFDIFNANNDKVFYADGDGNINATGNFTSIKRIDSFYDANLSETFYLWQGVWINGGFIDVRYAIKQGSATPSTNISSSEWTDVFTTGLQYDFSNATSVDELSSLIYGEAKTNIVRASNVYSDVLFGLLNGEVQTGDVSYATGTAAIWESGTDSDGNVFYALKASSSSQKYKKNIDYINEDSSKIIDALMPVTYEDKDSGSGIKYYGFIAEDVDKICPMLVRHGKNGQPESLMYDRITVLLADDNKKLRKRVDELESRLAKLEELITSR